MIRAGTQMRHVTITLMREELPAVSLILAEMESFAADERPLLESELPEIPGHTFRARIRRAWGHLDRLNTLLGETTEANAAPTPTRTSPVLVPPNVWCFSTRCSSN